MVASSQKVRPLQARPDRFLGGHWRSRRPGGGSASLTVGRIIAHSGKSAHIAARQSWPMAPNGVGIAGRNSRDWLWAVGSLETDGLGMVSRRCTLFHPTRTQPPLCSCTPDSHGRAFRPISRRQRSLSFAIRSRVCLCSSSISRAACPCSLKRLSAFQKYLAFASEIDAMILFEHIS